MTQWEQLKKEYSEINVPEKGKHLVMEAMSEAKKKRDCWKSISRYSSVAAAVLLVLLFPAMMLGGGMEMAQEDCANIEMDNAPQSTENSKADASMKNGFADSMEDKEYTAVGEAAEADDNHSTQSGRETAREEISKEIIRQMEERMQTLGETYYIKSEDCPDGFEWLEGTEMYAYTSTGELIVIFKAGKVAPESQGNSEFVIPKEIYAPQE